MSSSAGIAKAWKTSLTSICQLSICGSSSTMAKCREPSSPFTARWGQAKLHSSKPSVSKWGWRKWSPRQLSPSLTNILQKFQPTHQSTISTFTASAMSTKYTTWDTKNTSPAVPFASWNGQSSSKTSYLKTPSRCTYDKQKTESGKSRSEPPRKGLNMRYVTSCAP